MFEMIFGERPFRSKMRKELIKKGQYRCPAKIPLSDDGKSAIAGFLRMDAHTRLGVGFEGMVALRRHPFFSSLSWERIPYKQVSPVFVPEKGKEPIIQGADTDDLVKAMKAPKKRKSAKIMSADLITIYYEFGVRFQLSKRAWLTSDYSTTIIDSPKIKLNLNSVATLKRFLLDL